MPNGKPGYHAIGKYAALRHPDLETSIGFADGRTKTDSPSFRAEE